MHLHVRLQRCMHLFILFQLLIPYSMATLNFVHTPYNFSIQENSPIGTFVGNISVISSGLNPATYHIANQTIVHTFSLDLNSGILCTNSSLNFEERSSYQLSIEARAGTQSALTTVIVSVIDIDDVSPVCERFSFTIYVSENSFYSPPNTLLSLPCTDVDSSVIYFDFISGNDQMKFRILNSSFILFGPLNYSETSNYSLSIAVSDNSTTSQLLSVFVQVLPDSDLPPVFTQDGKYNLQLSEDTPIGPIHQITLTNDYAGSAEVIAYSIVSGDGSRHFSINSSTGILYLQSSLDRETIPLYSLFILAFDQSVYPLMLRTAVANVNITVLDVNDNAPTFNSVNLSAFISKDFSPSTHVVTLSCTDADSGNNGTIASYSLDSPFFRIDPFRGDVYLNASLPSFSAPQLSFHSPVSCTDSGSPPLSRQDTLVISVRQSNFYAPNFTAVSAAFDVLENTYLPGMPLFEVTATDSDSDFEGDVVYAVTGGADSNDFFLPVPSIGHVHTSLTHFDRESRPEYKFEVTATDRALQGFRKSSSLLVTVLVSDENDNSPVFSQHSYFTSIHDNNTMGLPLPAVSCSDSDSGRNGRIEYSLTFDPFPILSINSSTGTLQLSTAIKLESDSTRVITSYILCRDGGVPPKSDIASYNLQVVPVNEHPPTFPQDNYTAEILPEDSPPETFVIQVTALDQDASPAGRQLEYSIRSSLGSDYFAIGSSSGNITVSSRLNATLFPTYELIVKATGAKNLSDDVTVYIPIFNVNEDAPVLHRVSFINQNQTVQENSPPGLPVARIQCLDMDDILPDNISYRLDPNSLMTQEFVVTSDGLVTTGPDPTDCETIDRYDIVIICSDNESPPRTAQASIRIMIGGVNEIAPHFVNGENFIFKTVAENVPLYTEIVRINAVDEDCGSDGEILTYRLTNDPLYDDIIGPWFNITDDGMVYTIDYLDGELVPNRLLMLTLEVEAIDNGNPSLTSRDQTEPGASVVFIISVLIININDKPPEFSESNPITIIINENTPPNIPIHQVECTDPDRKDNVFIVPRGSSEPFSVSNGNISVTPGHLIDYEQSQQHTFYLSCSDSNFTTDIQVNVLVRPLNDNPVRFQSNFYQFNLSRTATPGETIGVVVIVDADIDELTLPVVSVLNYTGPFNPLTVNSAGVLTLSSLISPNLNDSFYLQLRVDDGISRDSTLVKIQLVEGNLNSPEFSQDLYIVGPISAPNLVGSSLYKLTCTDRDYGSNGEVDFRITHSFPQADFSIGSDGVLRVLNPLNANLNSDYNLLVTCFDHGSPVRFNTTVVSVTVSGGNTCPPVFILTDTYFNSISEDVQSGVMVGQVFTTDCDVEMHLNPTYVTLSHPSQFYIDPVDGKIFVKGNLDRETEEVIDLLIRAENEPFNPTDTFRITLLDVNDNAPRCSPPEYFVRVSENARDGEFILSLDCSDPDLGLNSELTFSPLTSPSPFSLLANGSVYLNSATLFNAALEHEFRLMVQDRGTPPLNSTAILYVSVAPANLFAPEFQGSSQNPGIVTISEVTPLGSRLFTFVATDNDVGSAESSVRYAIASGNLGTTFQIHPEEGRLTLNLPPDFSRTSQYILSISARDLAALNPKTAYTTITIHVTTANRFIPACSDPQYSLFVEESRVGPFLALECSDADGAPVFFSLDSGNTSLFQINSSSGSLSLFSSLDFESTTVHSLAVRVSDGEAHILVPIQVLVAPINEFPPRFSSTRFPVEIAEDSTVPFEIITLTASDSDTDNITTKHGQVQYQIIDGNDDEIFTIGNSNGVLYLVQILDFETISFYNLTVMASDPDFSDTSTVQISVLNVNDVTPYFGESLYVFSINTSYSPSSTVGTVRCFDTDFSNALNRSILSITTPNVPFSIDRQSGLLSLSINASLTSQSLHDFTVSCSDGKLVGFSQVLVSIEADSVELTFASGIYRFLVSESLPIGREIGQVAIANVSAALISFRLPDLSSPFSINSTGAITLSRSLDFESQSSYAFSVEASTDSFSTVSAAIVIVTVTDSNDNSPYFLTSPISLSMEESTPKGSVLLQITCQDADAGQNGQTSVRISGGNGNGFFILTPSGSFQLNSSIDYESLSTDPTIRLELTCSDGGSPPNSVTTNLTYYVLPTNERGPAFQNLPYQFSVRESAQTGVSLFRVQALDPDLGEDHNLIFFEILPPGSGGNPFLITSNGDILLASSLDHESVSSYSLVVRAVDRERRDAGEPNLDRFTDTANIAVTVTDVNEFSPEFSSLFYLAEIDSGVLSNTFVYSVNCTDRDEGALFSPIYALSGLLSTSFSILPSGLILTNATILHQTASSYLLTVSCADQGTPVRRAETSLLISIRDLNLLCPQFSQTSYSVQLSESVPIGTSTTRLNASSPSGASDISYSLLNTLLPFRVNQSSGEVSTASQLDFESDRFFALLVLATDTNSNTSCNSTATVLVGLFNVNEHSPLFSQPSFSAHISEGFAVGRNVLLLSCSDRDDLAEGTAPLLRIESGDPENKFSIQNQNLVLMSSLDIESQQNYTLMISCTDTGPGSLLSTSSLAYLSLLSVNEFAPLFENDSYQVSVSESAAVDTEILALVATDRDQFGHNSISYSILSGNDGFRFLLKSNKLIVSDFLDFETSPTYLLNISASDSSDPREALVSFSTVLIQLLDENDNPPVLLPPIAFLSVENNATAGTAVLQLSCTDADLFQNGSLLLDIESGNLEDSFALNRDGKLLVNKPFNLTTNSLYTLTIICRENATDPKRDTSTVVVSVIKRLSGELQFLDTPYSISIADTTPVESTVLSVSALDPESATKDHLQFSIFNLEQIPFVVDSNSGNVLTAKPLLSYSGQSIIFQMQVTDSNMPTRTKFEPVSIFINRTSNSAPAFQRDNFFLNTSELSSPSTQLALLNCSDGDNDLIRYTIQDGNENGTFAISEQTGRLVVGKSLDFESRDSYSLTVSCLDNGVPPLSATSAVHISVTAENEFTPLFPSGGYPPVSLNEDVLPGAELLAVNAVDADSGPDGAVSYQIIEGNVNNKFVIGSLSGRIQVSQLLDFEQRATYQLRVEARDSSALNPRSSSVLVEVQLVDVNDNCPRFLGEPYSAHLPSSAASGYTVARLMCSDADSGQLGRVNYSLGGDPQLLQYFQADSDGMVSLIRNLPIDSTRVYSLISICSDNAPSPCSVSSSLTVTQSDGNISPPLFSSSSYSLSLNESFPLLTPFFTASATDTDSGTNGQISYSIESSGIAMFSVNPGSGEIFLLTPLDFELSRSHNLTIRATDGTPFSSNRKSSATTLLLQVTNVNDNRPFCGGQSFTAFFTDTAVAGFEVISLNCSDPDTGPAGISFAIAQGDVDGVFTISNIGVLAIASTNPVQTNSSYALKIEVSDNFVGELVQKTSVCVQVYLTSSNDFCPQFSTSVFSTEVREDAAVGSTLLSVMATDEDRGLQGLVSYALTGGASSPLQFSVVQSTGDVILLSMLDRESVSHHSFSLQASDGDASSACVNQTVVSIRVTDANDIRPCLSKQFYSQTISQRSPINSLISSALAMDEDLGANGSIIYSLIPIDSPSSFQIDPTNGSISLVEVLTDYHPRTLFQYFIQAVDRGTPALSCSSHLSIYTTQHNTYPPVFPSPSYSMSVSEETPHPHTLLQLNATDRDSEYVSYHIVSGNEDLLFYVDSVTGVLSLQQRLDFENSREHRLVVEARDVVLHEGNPLIDTAEVVISVSNVNDNSPRLDEQYYSAVVNSSAAVGTQVLEVVCTDLDLAPHNSTMLSIASGGANGLFGLAPNGSLSIIKSLNTLAYNRVEMAVSCSDGQWTANAIVVVIITPHNFTGPIFSREIYSWNIPEHSQLGTSFSEVSASPPNTSAPIVFSIEGGNELERFGIDPQEGGLYVIDRLDRELTPEHLLTLSAVSEGVTALALLRVILIDINEHRPLISLQSQIPYVYTHSPPGTLVTSIACSDEDQDSNAGTRVSIAAGDSDSFFSITPSGILALRKSLAPNSVHTLTISCSDSGTPSLSATALITIESAQLNRFSPEFVHAEYVLDVLENITVASKLVNVTAIDLDQGLLGSVTYIITSGNELNLFYIDPITALISLNSQLDFESTHSHRLTVIATDGDDGRNSIRSSTAYVTVNVYDVNDNAPVFQYVRYSAHVPLNTSIGSELVLAVCTDADSSENGEISYSFTSNSSPLSVYNGSVSLSEPLSASTPDRISLVLQCRDHGSPNLVSTAYLDVFVRKDALSPLFSQSVYRAVVSEYAQVGYQLPVNISAEDMDAGNNGVVVYEILQCEVPCPFSIHRTTGVVSVTGTLDFESSSSHLTFVQAVDDGSFSHVSVATLHVDILNENDNTPRFDQDIFSVRVPEDVPINSALLSVQCTDLDSDLPTYNITDGLLGGDFTVSERGVLLVSGELDYETRSSYVLTVHCLDSVFPVRTDSAVIHVSISNSNEFAPAFNQSIYNLSASESLQFGSHVFSLQAADGDAGSLGEITYSIVGGNVLQTFSIASTDGMVFLTGTLDYERTPSYFLTVYATDGGGLVGRAYVFLLVENVNDNAPQFTQSLYSRTLSISEPVGRNVVEVRCSDRDGTSVSYAIASGNTGNYFNISALTGLVAVSRDLSGSSLVIILTLTCSDIDTHLPARAVVSFNILRDSSCPIQFSQPHYQAQVSEDASLNQSVLTLTVTGSSSDISYILTPTSLPFFANSAGLLTLTTSLDAETQSQYTFNVKAVPNDITCADPPQVSVTILVEDLNEFAPLISPSVLTVLLQENSVTFSPIAQFSCEDPDASNGTVSFIGSIESSGSGFEIDPMTGQVRLLMQLDYESETLHRFTIRCKESGPSPMTGSATLNVRVGPENEFPPQFPFPSYQLNASESLLPGTSVARIVATDGDSPLSADGQLQYSLLGTSLFSVSSDGDISVRGQLDRETEPVLNFTLLAADRGNSSLTASAAVTVSLLDVNDNPPQFHPLTYSISLNSSHLLSEPVASIRCTDPDQGVNSRVALSLEGSNISYALQNVTGRQGETNATLLASSPPSDGLTSIQVVCTDSGVPALSSSAQISIFVASDCATPSFLPTHYTVTLPEDFSTNAILINTTATYDNRCPHQFHILSGAANTFEIHERSGYIYTINSLDFEAVSSYLLTLSVVSLTATGAKSSTATAAVSVSNSNDNLPELRPARLTVTRPEDSPTNQEVATFSCTDLDAGETVALSIQSGDDLINRFSISQQGVVSLLNSLDFEVTRVYDLVITCSEAVAVPPHTATALLTVLVAAVNDHDPMFFPSAYSSSLPEDASIGTTVLTLSASDGDFSALHNKTLFALSGPNSNLFRVTSEGSVISADLLDAEVNSLGLYQFSALAFNEAAGASTATATVTISLTDVNESPPACGGGLINLELQPRSYSNEAVGGTIVCTDADISTPVFSASLISETTNDPALQLASSISGSSLSLSLTGTVAYPAHVTPNQYTLRVSDGGSPVLSADTLIYLRVIPPPGALTFSPSSLTRTVPENFPINDLLIDVSPLLLGTDRDSAAFSATSPLSINSEGEVILATSLDYESILQHSVQISASVGTEVASLSLLIHVEDVNDNSPQFTEGNIIRRSVSESTSPPATILSLRAPDADSGLNGMVTFSLESSSSTFGLFTLSSSGTISLVGALDREHTPSYSLQVQASDRGSPTKSAVAVVIIQVDDVNDNPPRFQSDTLSLFISHTLQIGTTFHTFQVSDPDLNPMLSFSIIGQLSSREAFGVNSEGEMTLSEDLINIPSQTFEFDVEVSDRVFTDSISVQISVINLNADVELTLRENSPIGSVVWNATSYVSGNYTPSASATYALTTGNFAGKFDIGLSTGLLTTAGDIDYEEEFVFTFVIQITDPANSVATAPRLLVYLLVLDENDNDPIFNHSLAPVQLLEGQYIQPYELTRAVVTDRDSGVYAQLGYQLVHANSGREATELPFHFIFDGRLFAQGVVDREAFPMLDLLVLVRDASSEPRNATAPISISILDVNDNPPNFFNLTSPIDLTSNHPIGDSFFSFFLSDPDQGSNGTVEFDLEQISPGSPHYFNSTAVSTDNGLRISLVVAEIPPGLPEVFNIELRLTASDQGSPPLSSSRNVTVSVVAADLMPSFRSDFYWIDVHFSTSAGSSLLTVQLERMLATIVFSIDDADEGDFSIDAAGTLSSRSAFQREFSNYALLITATNMFGGKLSTSTAIVNSVRSEFITELLLNVSFSDFVESMATYEQQLLGRVPRGNTLRLIEHHIQDGLVNVSLYVVQGVWNENGTSQELIGVPDQPKPFLAADTICELYFNPESSLDVMACKQRIETRVPEVPMFFQTATGILVIVILLILILLFAILFICLCVFIYYKRQEEKILADELIFEHPYMIARPLGAYEMQEELRKLGKRGRASEVAYDTEGRGFGLARGRDYHSSDENIDEINQYVSSDSSISVYGQDYSKFEQMEAWQKYRNMGPLLRQMVERWRDGDNIILDDDESKGEMSA